MTRSLVSLLDAFVPALCISCKAVGSLFCPSCRAQLNPSLHQVYRQHLVGWCAFDLDSAVGNLILAFKDRGRTALADYLARQLMPAAHKFDLIDTRLACLPSSRSALIRRGFDANQILAKALGKASGLPVESRVLEYVRQPADQRALSVAERQQNLGQSMKAKPGLGKLLLIDDVVTTGASLHEAARALVSAGWQVVGFITIAETLRQNENKY